MKTNLQNLGFSDWFSGHAAEILQPEQNVARVAEVDRDAYIVRDDEQETHAELAGRFRFAIERKAKGTVSSSSRIIMTSKK